MPSPDLFVLLKKNWEKHGITSAVTLNTLSLGAQDSDTGWFSKSFTPSTIHMFILTKSASFMVKNIGLFAAYDAVGYTKDVVHEGDEVAEACGVSYKVMSVCKRSIGTQPRYYELQLKQKPFATGSVTWTKWTGDASPYQRLIRTLEKNAATSMQKTLWPLSLNTPVDPDTGWFKAAHKQSDTSLIECPILDVSARMTVKKGGLYTEYIHRGWTLDDVFEGDIIADYDGVTYHRVRTVKPHHIGSKLLYYELELEELTVNNTAQFTKPTLIVEVNNSSMGTTDDSYPPGTYVLNWNDTPSVSALANDTYSFDHWLLDGATVGGANPYVVTMDADHTLEAVFIVTGGGGVEYTLTVSTNDVVRGTTDDSYPPGTYTLPEGDTPSVVALPNTGYYFDHWVLDTVDVGGTNPIIVTMDADHTLEAVFINYTIYAFDQFDAFGSPEWLIETGWGGTFAESTEQYHSAPHSAKCNISAVGSQAWAYTHGGPYPSGGDTHYKIWIYPPSGINFNGMVVSRPYETTSLYGGIQCPVDDTKLYTVGLVTVGGVTYLYVGDVLYLGPMGVLESNYSLVCPVNLDAWNLLEVYYLWETGVVHIYLNGVKKGGDWTTNVIVGGGPGLWYLGSKIWQWVFYVNTDWDGILYYDDLKVDNNMNEDQAGT